MNLIECPECHHSVKQTTACSNCGFPLAAEQNSEADESSQSTGKIFEQPTYVSLSYELGSVIRLIVKREFTSFFQHRFVRQCSGICIGVAGPKLLLIFLFLLMYGTAKISWEMSLVALVAVFISCLKSLFVYFLIPGWIKHWLLARRFPFTTGVLAGFAAFAAIFFFRVVYNLYQPSVN